MSWLQIYSPPETQLDSAKEEDSDFKMPPDITPDQFQTPLRLELTEPLYEEYTLRN